jgi:putative membrane protein
MGSMAAGLAVSGPVSEAAHADFAMHMVSHLLLGMLAPLCMVMAAPRTLILRVLPVPLARHLSRAMKLRYIQFIADPLVASLLNMGGLWLLYATFLYAAMHHFQWLYVLLHIHVFLAGYLFTASMIEIDPRPHRPRFIYRAVVLVIALAAHSILAKFLYAHPPPHVPAAQAKLGALIMYYGGDLFD